MRQQLRRLPQLSVTKRASVQQHLPEPPLPLVHHSRRRILHAGQDELDRFAAPRDTLHLPAVDRRDRDRLTVDHQPPADAQRPTRPGHPATRNHAHTKRRIVNALLALDVTQLRHPLTPGEQVRHVTRQPAVLDVAQPQRLLADPFDLPVKIHQQHPVALEQALVLQKPPRRRREPPARHMPLTPINPRDADRLAPPQQTERQIRQATTDLPTVNTNPCLERPRDNELRAHGRSHDSYDRPPGGRPSRRLNARRALPQLQS
jgi:hypothetical protein